MTITKLFLTSKDFFLSRVMHHIYISYVEQFNSYYSDTTFSKL
jgi:hypothetical protein